ncbi:MAG TPA: GtrA family protein [Coxiellaceae bacterium]|nr:GtrA family protein [Coxiellaceae bacterium]
MVKALVLKHKPFIFQVMRFGIIGLSATTVQFLSVVGLVEWLSFNPLVANASAFIGSTTISYLGHRQWTFHQTEEHHRHAIPKFLLTALTNLGVMELLYSLLLYHYHLHYIPALFIVVCISAGFNFTVSKFWTFKDYAKTWLATEATLQKE